MAYFTNSQRATFLREEKRCRNDLTRRKKGRLFLLNVDLILVVLFDYSSARLFSYVNQYVREYKN